MKTSDIEQAVDHLLEQLTLEEKVSLCHAGSKFAVAPIPRVGIPEFQMSDGPHGVRREISRDSWDPVETDDDYATYLPTGTALASTWNLDLARKFGEVLGAEARARGKDVILGPGINIIRDPLCGRNFEYYGEDPFHISKMVVPVIQGIQSQGVAACVKHYAANSQELNRSAVDARMDERTLREIYLPGFKAAVIEGGVWTVMGAYNQFRGQYCGHNEYLVNTILKKEWGFDGAYISDWAGTHDTLEAAKNGLDLEMGTSAPYDEYFLAQPFLSAIASGELNESLLNDKARRNLRVMFRAGLFDEKRPSGERNSAKHQQVALEIAREAIVLLKNDNGTLPLRREKLHRLLVIGDNASALHALGGNSSGVKAAYERTPLDGLKDKLGPKVEILHYRGYPLQTDADEPISSEYLGTADEGSGTHGWKGRYYSNRDCNGVPRERADLDVDFDWTDGTPFPDMKPGEFSIIWETTLTPSQTGTYSFVLTGANHAGIEMDGHALIQRWEDIGPDIVTKNIDLTKGRGYHIRISLKPNTIPVRIKLGWVPPWHPSGSAAMQDDLLQAAAQADAVVFFGGQNHQYDVEGSDRRDMALHDGQNELLEKIIGLNPTTVMVLVGGSPVEMPWVNDVPAIVQMWYAGMEGGNAIAEVLLGDVNPSGKLPMTFPKALEDAPSRALRDYSPDICHYREGIFVGYRWFDHKGIEPLFPFGHGLSYTTFELADLQIKVSTDQVLLSVNATNTGVKEGTEVVQIYMGMPDCPDERPIRELKGFAKINLHPGETRLISLPFKKETFAYWSLQKNGWATDSDKLVFEAGFSSRDIRCMTTLSLL